MSNKLLDINALKTAILEGISPASENASMQNFLSQGISNSSDNVNEAISDIARAIKGATPSTQVAVASGTTPITTPQTWYCFKNNVTTSDTTSSLLCYTTQNRSTNPFTLQFAKIEKPPRRIGSEFVTNVYLDLTSSLIFIPIISIRKKLSSGSKKVQYFQIEVISSKDILFKVMINGNLGPGEFELQQDLNNNQNSDTTEKGPQITITYNKNGIALPKNEFDDVSNIDTNQTAVKVNTRAETITNGTDIWTELIKGSEKRVINIVHELVDNQTISFCAKPVRENVQFSSFLVRWIEEW